MRPPTIWPTLFACAFHSMAASSLSYSAMHLYCKGLERRAHSTFSILLAVRVCFAASGADPLLWLRPSRLLKPSAQAVCVACSSRLFKPPAHSNQKPPAQSRRWRDALSLSRSRKLPSVSFAQAAVALLCLLSVFRLALWGRGRGSRQVTSSWSFSIVCRHLVLRYGNSHICTLW